MDIVMAHGQDVDLDWSHPGPKELSIAAEFIQSEDQRNPNAPFALSANFDPNTGKFGSLTPYARLEKSLRSLLPEALGLEVPQKNTPEGWGTLCDKVLNAQNDYTTKQQSSWRRIWHGVGKASENVDVWVGWIPDEFGLAVVKTGLALVITLAGRSLEKRQKILMAFEAIQEAMASADPRKVSFQAHEDVVKASESLYKSILESIELLIDLTKEERSQWRRMVPKSEDQKKKTNVETVLQNLSEKTKGFERAISVARDHAIQRVQRAAHYTAMRTTLVHRDITENHKIVHDRIYSLQKTNSVLIETIKAESRKTTQQFAEMYEQNFKKVLAEADARADDATGYKAELDRLFRKEHSRRVKRGPVISPGDFWQLFAEWVLEEDGPDERYVPDDETSINHPVVDLEYVLTKRGNVKARTSSQAQTLLRHDRFLSWMNHANPDLILVNANIRSASQAKVSAMTILCADLVGCLVTARPEDVIIQFFCSLHADYDDDLFPGPAGLVRSLILQVFLRLISTKHLNLDFLYDRQMVEALRAHDLEAMCYTLHELLHGFPAGTRVFCIIDSVSMLDTFHSFRDLEVVMQCLRDIVDDRDLRAFFKVLVANNSTCSADFQSLPVFEERPDRIVNLSSGGLMPGGMSTGGMRRRISRSSSPSFSMADLGRMGGRPRSYHEYESDEGDSY
ncbi:hypothetical protein DHEL01_v210756 [Diaporthe helianthi]|uniref:Uncharacterized protein n=1 Tax=Diaporthe helianthi TaxID=158607 RepID=A0A2P5HKR6_DIAHE|nr:hypothetical protein DHEL01_v210756 [Diaporthe helianthi]